MKVTSYEISKKLRDIGFEVESDYYYCELEEYDKEPRLYEYFPNYEIPLSSLFGAYDLETILEALPNFHVHNQDNCQWVNYSNYDEKKEYFEDRKSEPLADTAARLLIKLTQENLIKL